MSLSRKHYEAVASELRQERQVLIDEHLNGELSGPELAHAKRAVLHMERRLADYFQADNPNFRPDTFRKAAQP